jgi:purine-binding chemotaxis protein CheW
MQIVLVRVRGEAFGLPASDVVEIIRAVAVSPLPGSPAVISGVINVRGNTVVVIDPAVRFGKPETPVRPDDNFVLVDTATRTLAVRVEIAEDLIDVDDEAVTAAKSASSSVDKIHGVAAMPDGALVIYDIGAFLSQAEDDAIAQALASLAHANVAPAS